MFFAIAQPNSTQGPQQQLRRRNGSSCTTALCLVRVSSKFSININVLSRVERMRIAYLHDLLAIRTAIPAEVSRSLDERAQKAGSQCFCAWLGRD